MRIDRMKEGNLYQIKSNINLQGWIHKTGPHDKYRVLAGFRERSPTRHDHPPFVYLGYKIEDWKYDLRDTNKVHYVLWKGEVWVMDNQFAKHIVPILENEDGQN